MHDSMVPKEVNLSRVGSTLNPSEVSHSAEHEMAIRMCTKDRCIWGYDALHRREV